MFLAANSCSASSSHWNTVWKRAPLRQIVSQATTIRGYTSAINIPTSQHATLSSHIRSSFTLGKFRAVSQTPSLSHRPFQHHISYQKAFHVSSWESEPRVGPGHPLSPLSLPFPVFCSFLLFLFLVDFNYFLLLSIPFLSTRIVPLRFQVGGRRKRPNLGLVCCVYFVLSIFCS